MKFKSPTYEEYQKATKFARFNYKYKLIFFILTWLCFLFVCYYMVVNGEAIARNPLIYGADKMNVQCHCYSPTQDFFVNSTSIYFSDISQINFSNINLIKE